MNNKKKKIIIISVILGVLIIGIVVTLIIILGKDNKKKPNITENNKPSQGNSGVTKPDDVSDNKDNNDLNKDKVEELEPPVINYEDYRITGNGLEDFDLYFLKVENKSQNKVYSPLSIKYALAMLEDGADGETKEQISNIIGDYSAKKYVNSENMSLANALFIKDTFKEFINTLYINTLKNKYAAEIIYDDFKTPDVLNSWVSNNTKNLIKELTDNISSFDFILVNALAIDMEWVNKIRDLAEGYWVKYQHEKFYKRLPALEGMGGGYDSLKFYGLSDSVLSLEFAATINKYDSINILGEDNIRKTVGTAYKEWLEEDNLGHCESIEDIPNVDEHINNYLDNYIKEINSNYKKIDSSTDFEFYVDDSVKVFAKDLKEYNGTTLQYIGIMPTTEKLNSYVKNLKASDLNNLINNLKSIKLENFKEGFITDVHGYIPMFDFDYELNLIEDLKKLGISNVFDNQLSDLSKLSSNAVSINDAKHKATIQFTNDGIKAAAVTGGFGGGGGDCESFDYIYDVPIEEIDLTFDKPYLFIIRDKNSGEVWFTGTVYKPRLWKETTVEYIE